MADENLPMGHTSFSWAGADIDPACFIGHTRFSLCAGAKEVVSARRQVKKVSWKRPLTEEKYVETFYSEQRRMAAALLMKSQPRKSRAVTVESAVLPKEVVRRRARVLIRRDSSWEEAEKSVRVTVVNRIDGRTALIVVRAQKSAEEIVKQVKAKFKLKGKGFQLRDTANKDQLVSSIDPASAPKQEMSLSLVRENG